MNAVAARLVLFSSSALLSRGPSDDTPFRLCHLRRLLVLRPLTPAVTRPYLKLQDQNTLDNV